MHERILAKFSIYFNRYVNHFGRFFDNISKIYYSKPYPSFNWSFVLNVMSQPI
jgi:hypothetical protein